MLTSEDGRDHGGQEAPSVDRHVEDGEEFLSLGQLQEINTTVSLLVLIWSFENITIRQTFLKWHAVMSKDQFTHVKQFKWLTDYLDQFVQQKEKYTSLYNY